MNKSATLRLPPKTQKQIRIKNMNITKTPKTKAAKTQDGISTGMLITLEEGVAIDSNGQEKVVPAGSLISRALSGGFDGRINGMSDCRKLGTGGDEVVFRA